MKLCPQCDFIYDDDQDRCDMDGEVLECAPGVLPDPQKLTAPPPPRTARPGRLRLPALLISGVILGTILPTGYYVHTRQAATAQTDHAPAGAVETPQPETTSVPDAPAPETTRVPDAPAPAPNPSPESPPTTQVRQSTLASQKRAGRAAQAVRPAQKPSPPPAAKREVREPRPERADNKKGSKLGAVLKKTGRILKKPFEF